MLEHGYLGSRTELRGMGLDLNKKRVFDRVKKIVVAQVGVTAYSWRRALRKASVLTQLL